MEQKKLCRSASDCKIAGVCAGLAAYLGIDPTIVRLIWAVLVLCCGTGALLYIVAALVIPKEAE